jgi:ABC-type glycerol-3-phosphate transport system substrate-binding protein
MTPTRSTSRKGYGHFRGHGRATIAALLGAATLVVAGCADATPPSAASKPTTAFTPVAQDETQPITVWVDAVRQGAVDAYKKAHPNAKIEAVNISGQGGSTDLQTKIQLFDRTGEGWPDVAWPGIQDPSWATTGKTPFAAPISDLLPKETLDKYAAGAHDLCTANGKIHCLRNDLAQNVLWYNKKLMDEFGYTVPTTWEEWAELGLKVAKDHPGYLVGEIGSPGSVNTYYWASQCPMSSVTDDKQLTVNMHDPKCARMTKILDELLAAGALSKVSKSDTGFVKERASKLLMMPGSSWFGKVLFQNTYKTPEGQIAAASPLKFSGDDKAYTGAGGGGMWFVSSHSKNLKAALHFVEWVTQNPEYTASAGTYPAYKPAAAGWLAAQQSSGYFASDLGPAFATAADSIWPGWKQSTAFSQEKIYGEVIIPAITAGKTIESQIDTWQTAIENKAKSLGYTVKD